jgi:hypothetical protein
MPSPLYRSSCCYRAGLWATIVSVKPTLLTATRWKFMEHTSDYRTSTRRRAASYAVARTVHSTAVARRQRTISTLTLPDAPSTVSRSASTHLAAPLRLVLSMAPISANGSCAMALHWIGFNTRKADTTGSARRRAGRSSIWKGSYVEPWLYRACIRASGKPSDCSDDVSAHP